MPQYVNQERGGHTGQTQKRSDGRRGAKATVAEAPKAYRLRRPAPRRSPSCPPGPGASAAAAVASGRLGGSAPAARPADNTRIRSQCRTRKNKTKTTRGSHVLETDGRGLRHPPPARRGMLAHPHRTACPRPRHPGSSIDDRGCYMLAPHRTACPGPRLTATTCPCAPRGPLTAHAPTLTHRQ
jgi:hypothetical protein